MKQYLIASPLIAIAVVLMAGWTSSTAVVEAQGVDASAYNFSQPGQALRYLIATSYALNPQSVDCINDGLGEIACNQTTSCYYNQTLQTCLDKTNSTQNATVTIEPKDPWCFRHFPTPLIATVYMVGAFVLGFAVAATIYNAMWYDTYSRVNDVGERQFNQYYLSTAPINIYCVFIALAAAFMFIFTFVNLRDGNNCIYVIFTYIFILGFFIPAIGVPLWWFIIWLRKQCKGQVDTDLTLDEWTLPKLGPENCTVEGKHRSCLDTTSNCQTRCF